MRNIFRAILAPFLVLAAAGLTWSHHLPNLVVDPGFEANSPAWVFLSNAARVNTPVHTGAWACALTSDGATGGIVVQSFATVPGRTYTMSFWARRTVPGEGVAYGAVDHDTGTDVGSALYIDPAQATGDWQYKAQSVVAIGTTTDIFLLVPVFYGVPGAQWVVDDIGFFYGPAAVVRIDSAGGTPIYYDLSNTVGDELLNHLTLSFEPESVRRKNADRNLVERRFGFRPAARLALQFANAFEESYLAAIFTAGGDPLQKVNLSLDGGAIFREVTVDVGYSREPLGGKAPAGSQGEIIFRGVEVLPEIPPLAQSTRW